MKQKRNVFGYSREDIADIGRMDELNKTVTSFASWGAMVIAIGAFITLSFLTPFSVLNILSGICLINVALNNLFAEKYLGHKMKRWVDNYCVAFFMVTVPIQWYELGGFAGPGGLWMVFAAVYCVYGVRGKAQAYMQLLFAIEANFVMITSLIHPEYVNTLPDRTQIIISYASILMTGAYVQVIQSLHSREYVRDRKQLEKLREDITSQYNEALAMNDELANTTQRLEIANKTQRSFTASMNHELRSPLNGIEGCLQILLMDETLSDEARETVRNALTASKTINQTVNDLLDFAKLEENKFEIVNRPFDLRDILDNISTIFRPQAQAKDLQFAIQIQKESRVSLVADSVRIQQVMTNLISNGIKYTKEGTITMKVSTERGHLKFSVEDTGQGMDEESIKVLFDPFTRFNLEENNKIQGTGLGMNIASNLVREMGGTINVESTVGVGSVFHVDIPIMFYDSEITFSSLRTVESINRETLDLSHLHILCVDDTEINRTVFKGLLKKTGVRITMADSGKKAVNLCKMQKFDYIFLDHQMPEMDGIDTMEAIRKLNDGMFANVPIIMFTGNVGEEYRRLYKEKGANGYLEKPIMFEELIAVFR